MSVLSLRQATKALRSERKGQSAVPHAHDMHHPPPPQPQSYGYAPPTVVHRPPPPQPQSYGYAPATHRPQCTTHSRAPPTTTTAAVLRLRTARSRAPPTTAATAVLRPQAPLEPSRWDPLERRWNAAGTTRLEPLGPPLEPPLNRNSTIKCTECNPLCTI